MAASQLSKNYHVGRLTNYVFEKGSEVVRSSVALISRSTVPQRVVATLTLLTSIWMFSLSNFWSGEKNPSNKHGPSKQSTLAKMRKLKVVRFSAWVAERFLSVVELIVTPTGVKETSQLELPTGNTDSDSNSSATQLGDSFGNKLRETRGIRHQMASRVRALRLALQDECDGRSGFYELQGTRKSSSFLSRAWNAIFGRKGLETEIVPVQELRKRKRPDGDDYLTVEIPLNKGLHRLTDADSRHVFSEKASEAPIIQGLSIVPIIGNWYSAERSDSNRSQTEKPVEQLDHISLVQRDYNTHSKNSSEHTSDGEQYEILDMEIRNGIPGNGEFKSE